VLDIAEGKLAGHETLELDDAEAQTDLPRKIKAFGRTALFDGLSRSQLRLLAFASDWFDVKAGGYIFREGDDADAVYLITQGLGELCWEDAGNPEFEGRFIRPGRLIGDLSVIEGRPRKLSLIVREDVKGLRIGASEFLEMVSSDPDIAMTLLRTISTYLGDVTEKMKMG